MVRNQIFILEEVKNPDHSIDESETDIKSKNSKCDLGPHFYKL